jgi:poly-gamma-glutamate capsule biosynthesis protein CapA/YwtB (metallophosphatase superfamily)
VSAADDSVTLFLCGDVMTGRGVDQVLPHPGSPVLHEPYIRDAREYVTLAERANGAVPRPLESTYPWGHALGELLAPRVDVRIINLETSITSNDEAWPNKEIHYRMHPDNIGVLAAARIDCCCVANNHVLDYVDTGLHETLVTLERAGIDHAGAGRCAMEASSPAILEVPGKGRVLVFAMGSITSGIPPEWAATANHAGVNLLPDLSEQTAERMASAIREMKLPGDLIVASIHWGTNWGYEIPHEHITFAHRLIDEGVDLVHGHSAHHPKACEVYRERLILYGCGDFLDDYEGISGYEAFRADLRLGYMTRLEQESGRLQVARLLPFQLKRFTLNRASPADAMWLCNLLNSLNAPFGAPVQLLPDSALQLGS